jgi:energy-coupling factor transporter ATP-binding protein EcfA2
MTLSLESAGYRYAGVDHNALTDVSIQLEPGDVVGVVGASEAGKSTLCLVASGLAPGTIGGRLAGKVTIDGLETDGAPAHLLAQHCGILFQQPATQLSATAPSVWEEVAVGPRNLALPLAEVVDRTWAALRLLNIEALAERDPGHLSGGQMQLVALAGVLAMRPVYLILDEPTAQLDPAGTELVARAIDGLAEQGTAILIAEQKTDLLSGLCDRVVVLEAGSIVLEGPANEVLADSRLKEWGVEPPAPVRLRRALANAGLARELPL